MDKTIKVVIVDDQVLCREGLRALMGHWEEFEIIGEASNGEEAIEVCRRLKPDMVLMDIQMPVMSGVESLKAIRAENDEVDVIMLTVDLGDDSLFGALRNGAKGYVLKDTPSKELRNKLLGVARGEFPLSGLAAKKLVNQIELDANSSAEEEQQQPQVDYSSVFTPREIEILRLVAQGLSNSEIGAILYLGAGTVKKHLSAIMQKLDLENRVQVATFAYRSGIMDGVDEQEAQ